MLRVHFTQDDLLRLKVAANPDPLWETVLSANLLGTGRGAAVFDPWRDQARSVLHGLPAGPTRLVRAVAPPRGDFPDFLTPPEAGIGLREGIEAVLTTPRRRLRRELTVLSSPPSWLRPLAEGRPDALAGLGRALHAYFDAVLAPYWPRVRAQIEADRAVRARALLDAGSEGLLNSLRPTLRWRAPVLEADYPVDRDVRLDGRGLLLVPSVFCWRSPVTLIDPLLPPVLVYPVRRIADWWNPQGGRDGRAALSHLVGRGRAAVLRALDGGCTTSELARRTGMALPTASEHACVLREAGLLVSVRQRNTVVHTLTPLGADLLAANPPC
jgi:DNA-binding transcriptional ArsR family regulator